MARGRTLATIVALTAFAMTMIRVVRLMSRHREPKEWDFLCFWTWGRMGVLGLDFYDPASGAAFAAGRSKPFVQEVLDVGLWYPPQSMLLFSPLGFFEPRTALVGWYTFHGLCALASIALLWKLFAPRSGALGFAMIGAGLLLMPSTAATFSHGQTNMAVLLVMLAIWHDRSHWRGGVWAALALIIKPYLVIGIVFLLLVNNWRAIGAAVLTFSLVAGLTGVLFGFDKFVTYALENPLSKAPAFIYLEDVNQSLLSTYLRVTGQAEMATQLGPRLAAGTLVALIGLPTAWAALRVRRQEPLLLAALVLMFALIAYPMSLWHYSVLLSAPLLLLWSLRERLPGGALVTGVAAAVLIGLMAVLPHFWVRLALLGWLIAASFMLTRTWARGTSVAGPAPIPG